MQRAERRVKMMVQALAVAERQRDVTRSFSRKEQRQDVQRSTPPTDGLTALALTPATAPVAGLLLLPALFELSSITPGQQTRGGKLLFVSTSSRPIQFWEILDNYLTSRQVRTARRATGGRRSAGRPARTRATGDSTCPPRLGTHHPSRPPQAPRPGSSRLNKSSMTHHFDFQIYK